MLPSFFRAEERKQILGFVDEWESLKGAPKTEDEEGDLVSAKDLLIDRIIRDLFSTFPERDISVTTGGSLVWMQDDRDRLHGVGVYNTLMSRQMLTLSPCTAACPSVAV